MEPVLSRADTVKGVLWLRALMDAAKEKEAELRGQLSADARAELEEQGSAPTWRVLDLARVSLSVSQEAVYVADEWLFRQWVEKRYPDKVEQVSQVKPGWQKHFLAEQVHVDLGVVFDGDTGELVPGLGLRPGGVPLGVSVTATPAAKQVFAALAEHGLQRLAIEAGPAVPTVLAEVSDGGS
jgi:hypothetical protein